MFKKACSLVLCLVLMLSAFVIVPPQRAEADTIDNVVSQLQKVYEYLAMDEDGFKAVQDAKNKIRNLPGYHENEMFWDGVLGQLLTPEVKKRLGQDAAASTLADFLKAAAAVSYSNDAATLRSNLEAFKRDHQTTVTALFDSDFNIDNLYGYLMAAKGMIPDVIKEEPQYLINIITDDYKTVQESLKNMAVEVLDAAATGDYAIFKDKLSAIGWSVDILIEALNKLSTEIGDDSVDPGFAGQIALMKAYVRSETTGTAISINAGSTYNLSNYNLTVLGYTVPGNLLNWQSNDTSKVTVNNTTKVVTAVATGTATLTAYNTDANTNWVYKATVTVTSGGGGGGGGAVTPPLVPGSLPSDPAQANQQVQNSLNDIAGLAASNPAQAAEQVAGLVQVIVQSGTQLTSETVAKLAGTMFNVVQAAGKLPETALQSTEKGSYTVDAAAASAQIAQLAGVVQTVQQSVAQLATTGVQVKAPIPVLTVQAPELSATGKAEVTVPTGVVSQLAGVAANAEVAVATPVGILAVPVSVASGSQGDLKVSFQENPAPQVVDPNAGVAGKTVDVTVALVAGESGRTVTSFKAPVKLFLPYNKGQVRNPAHLGVYKVMPDGSVKFVGGKVMPDGTVGARLYGLSTYTVLEYNKTFADLAGHWSKSVVERMAARQVVKGVSDTQFLPDRDVTRAEFATLLVRALSLDVEAPTGTVFGDVPAGAWYAGAVEAAFRNDLVSGIGGGKFAPNARITREQMAVMINRALKKYGSPLSLTGTQVEDVLKGYDDGASISGWARQSLAEAVKAGLIKGRAANLLAPLGNATRAEAATILSNLIDVADIY